jgi:hypothetical protein
VLRFVDHALVAKDDQHVWLALEDIHFWLVLTQSLIGFHYDARQ